MVIIIFIALQITNVVIGVLYYTWLISQNLMSYWTMFLYIFDECIHVIISSILVYMFISRLIKVILLKERNRIINSSNDVFY